LRLTSFELIEINATVMVGLLILVSFTPPPLDIFDPNREQKIRDLSIEEEALSHLISIYCPAWMLLSENIDTEDLFFRECYELSKEHERVTFLRQKYLDDWKYDYPDEEPYGVIAIRYFLQNSLLIPFIISAVSEVIRSIRSKEKDNPSSKFGLITLIVGFLFLGGVMTINAIFPIIRFF